MFTDSRACRVVIYCRVSTQEQQQEGWSLDGQEHRCRQYANLMNLEVVEVIHEVGSAKTLDGRKKLIGVMDRLLRGEVQGLLVARLDRLSRSVQDMAALINGVFARSQLLSVTDNIDTRSAAGRMVINMIATVAQWERETISERTSEAMRRLQAKGKLVGSAPWGKQWQATAEGECELVDCAAEIATRDLLAQWRRNGMTYVACANKATKMRLPKRRGTAPWRHTDVLRILKGAEKPTTPTADDLRRRQERQQARRMHYARMRGLPYEEVEAAYQARTRS